MSYCVDSKGRQRFGEGQAFSKERPEPVYVKSAVGTTGRLANRDELLLAARGLAAKVADLAFWVTDDIYWMGLQFASGRKWILSPARFDLYNGMLGIALFLAYAARLTKTEEYVCLARAALDRSLSELDKLDDNMLGIGPFDGLSGAVYVLTHLGAIWSDEILYDRAVAFVARIAKIIRTDKAFDIASGSAGCILVLIGLYQRRPNSAITRAIRACADHLLNAGHIVKTGMAWKTNVGIEPLGGFAHGAAGIAVSLQRACAHLGDARLCRAAQQAIRYQLELYTGDGRWSDFRRDAAGEAPRRDTVAWCHGAPGIALSLLDFADQIADQERVLTQLNGALSVTESRGFGGSHCLCHGDLGNADILLHSGNILREARWIEKSQRIAGSVLDDAAINGFKCGLAPNAEPPGLMTGLAGIGYGLLRIADAERVPSILALSPPIYGTNAEI